MNADVSRVRGPVAASRPPVVVMGVSGCGKTTIGLMLAGEIGVRFIDADDLHPQANRNKMASGVPLDDDDRKPWLEAVGRALAEVDDDGAAGVVACSALKRRYRDELRRFAPDAFFAHLAGSAEVIRERLGHRSHEFMPASLLDSQFAALEPLASDEAGVAVDLALPPAQMIDLIEAALATRPRR